jgi:hypothetical protein
LPDASPITVVETRKFLSATKKLMEDAERDELVGYLAFHPTAGDVIPGTGGVRKLRWGLEGRGKRGGARVIYFFHSQEIPLYLLEAYAKNERTNLTLAECNELRIAAEMILESHRRRRAGR